MSLFFLLILILDILDSIITILPKESNEEFNYLILVNKEHKLPDDYESKLNLVNVTNNIPKDNRTFQLEKLTYDYFVKLRQNLLEENDIRIELDSSYRSVARQQEIWDEFVEKYGLNYTEKYVAKPGYSEHHTGLALDICLVVNGIVIDDNEKMIKQKEIFAKIHKKLADYGFILRFLQGKENITGYNYEPWHFRFVQIDDAKNIMKEGITLEEYLSKNHSNFLNNNLWIFFFLIICLLF